MTCSTVLGGVVDECAWWAAESVVEADRGGECEEACVDAGSESVEGAGAVAFEGEEVFAGAEDRFDSLPDRGEMELFSGFVFAAWAGDPGFEVGGGGFELAAGVALVAEHREWAVAFAASDQSECDLAFGGLWGGERQ